METLIQRINQYEARTGHKPKYLVLSTLEIARLKIDLSDRPTYPELWKALTHIAGIPILSASDVMLPEEF